MDDSDVPRRLRRRGLISGISVLVVLAGALAAAAGVHALGHSGPSATDAAGVAVGHGGRAVIPAAPAGSRAPAPAGRLNRSAAASQAHGTTAGGATGTQPPAAPVSVTGRSAATASDTSALSWHQTVSGSRTALLVAVAVGNSDGDAGVSASVTDNGTAMTVLAQVHDDNEPFGFLEVCGLAGVADGTNTISLAVSGGPVQDLAGGSIVFGAAAPAGTFSAPATAAGSGATASVTAPSTPGGIIAAFGASGSPFTGTAAPAVSRFTANDDGRTRAGNVTGATAAATGGNVTVTWSTWNDFWGAAAVEVNS